MLDTHIETALKYQTRVESFDPDDEYRGELEELCITTKARLKALIKGLTPATQAVVPVAAPRTRLPHLALPKFSGKYSEFKNFISLFETLVHNDTTIPAIEKFNHLISCLSGEALGTTHPSSLATFVSNRVAEIQEWTENAEWRHVPTKQNPADIVSRGCDVDELVTSIWFNGPSFLKEPRDSWPVNQHLVTDEMRTLETVHCDNATNFVGASRQFRELRARVEEEADAIQEFASKSGCEFAFIPPRAPHFGGLWEAGVKSAKHLLLRTVGSLLLTAEELQTTLVAVEAVLNSRPIGALSDDPSDGEALEEHSGGPYISWRGFILDEALGFMGADVAAEVRELVWSGSWVQGGEKNEQQQKRSPQHSGRNWTRVATAQQPQQHCSSHSTAAATTQQQPQHISRNNNTAEDRQHTPRRSNWKLKTQERTTH
ncbi:hypothetical protein ACLKA6_001031 [Drosophila palustris]